ncbi:hypothetical protein LQZ21_08835 [Treponema sp. TIM-1]|uniref:hypothetical protein n=1 Tax=Treponema sp. TIM-1 TaxID=2898417 RepID=UPI00397EF90F
MKGFTALLVLCCGTLGIAGCALPLGEDYLLTRDGASNVIYITDYNLMSYVPIPKPGDRPVTLVDNRGDLEAAVVWKDEAGANIPLPFAAFAPGTVYKAEIRLSPKPGYGFYPSTPFTYPAGKVYDQINDLGDPIRTVTVIYNSSDDWNITFITDYNLQNYVPIPLAGEKPVWRIDNRGDLTGTVTWKRKTGTDTFTDVVEAPNITFVLDTVYQARIDLAVKDGYRFFAARNFYYPDGTAAVPQGDETAPNSRSFEVLYRATRTPIIINDFDLTPYVSKPISGTTALTSFAASQYTGTITWKKTGTPDVLTGPFQPNTAYTAELILNPASGYTVTGIGPNAFFHAGAETVGNPVGIGAVTLTFSPTGSLGSPTVVYDTILTARLPKPVSGMTPVTGINSVQYSGAISWSPVDSTFQEGRTYTAVLTLNAVSGYTFTGIGHNVFSHGEALGITNPADSGTVTITFPATASATYQVITSFGPVETEASALWLMRELKDDTYPLYIDLTDNVSNEPELVTPVVLTANDNCPATVIINGHGRTLKIPSTGGALLTVGGGVTLRLQHLTLEGIATNDAPLVRVNAGGNLSLGTGVVITGNESTGTVGGVWVDGGTLTLNNGGAIELNSAAAKYAGGGVYVEHMGLFNMNGGTIESNTVSGLGSGGGLYVKDGTVDMNGGTIQNNEATATAPAPTTAPDEVSGGGVLLSKGVFNMNGGIITDNMAPGPNPVNDNIGIHIGTSRTGMAFTMTGEARVASTNKILLDDGVIVIGGLLTSTGTVANIIVFGDPLDEDPNDLLPDDPTKTRPLVAAPALGLLQAAVNANQFLYDGYPGHIRIDSNPGADSAYVGYYQ